MAQSSERCISANDIAVILYKLLTWEHPLTSAATLITCNCLFWFIVSLNQRFFCTVGHILLGVFLYHTWVYKIWPEIRLPPVEGEEDNEGWTPINPQVLSVPEISHYINDFWIKISTLKNDIVRLRETNPGLFCILGCGVFSFIAFIGHMIPGVIIIYSLVLAVSLGPGIALHLVPATIYEQLVGFFIDGHCATDSALKTKSGSTDSELEEFLPETSDEVMRQLSLRHESFEASLPGISESALEDEDSHMTMISELGMENFSCESDESLYVGFKDFPSVEEDRESEDDDDDDLSGNIQPTKDLDDIQNGMHFVATHFKESSSESESDTMFTEGLSFKSTSEGVGKEPVAKSEPLSSRTSGNTQQQHSDLPRVSTSSELDELLVDFEILDDADIS